MSFAASMHKARAVPVFRVGPSHGPGVVLENAKNGLIVALCAGAEKQGRFRPMALCIEIACGSVVTHFMPSAAPAACPSFFIRGYNINILFVIFNIKTKI